MSADDAFRLRIDDQADRDEETRREAPAVPGAACQLVTVNAGAGVINAFMACTPASVEGTESQGSAGTVTGEPGTVFVFNLGTVAPPDGTKLVATQVPYRWVTRYDG